jgi:cysteine desulfurase
LKAQLIEQLRAAHPDVQFNGTSAELDESLDTVLNVSLPPLPCGQPLVDVLDARGIAVSGGSACSNLAKGGSHVLQAIGVYPNRENVRISLSRFTSQAEVETLLKQIAEVYEVYSPAKTAVPIAIEAAY